VFRRVTDPRSYGEQRVGDLIVVQAVAGSNPVAHRNLCNVEGLALQALTALATFGLGGLTMASRSGCLVAIKPLKGARVAASEQLVLVRLRQQCAQRPSVRKHLLKRRPARLVQGERNELAQAQPVE
jgi:hypothetical protein